MRLFRSELLRARSRRLVAMLLVGGMIATVVAMTIAAFNSSPASDTAIQAAQARYEKNLRSCLAGEVTEPNAPLPPQYDSLEDLCEDQAGPSLSDAGVWLHDLPVVLMGIATFVILLAAWLGASLAGADWTNNTMATLLTWEPRRVRVLLTRAVVVTLVIAFALLFLQVFFSVVYSAVAALFGTTALSPPGLWSDVAAVIGRVCVMGVAIGLVAYSVAMVGRSTVASLGALFGYLVLFEGVIAGFRPTIQSNLFVRAVGVIVSQQPILRYAETAAVGSGDSFPQPVVLLDVQRAWAVAAVYVVGLLVLALVVFRRRDVN
jgi:ABC-2 type transport system permease protein